MSQAEYDAMKTSGKIQESFSGTTHVASPADASVFINQAKPGSVYAEFNVPNSSLKATKQGWSKVIGPNSLEGRLAARKDLPIHCSLGDKTSMRAEVMLKNFIGWARQVAGTPFGKGIEARVTERDFRQCVGTTRHRCAYDRSSNYVLGKW